MNRIFDRRSAAFFLALAFASLVLDTAKAFNATRLEKGLNLWEWFSTAAGPAGVPDHSLRVGKMTASDFEKIKKAGFTNVRIGINPHSLLPNPLPQPSGYAACGTLHDSFFVRDLESAIATFVKNHIAVIVNVRFEGPAKDRLRTDSQFAVECLGRFWVALALELSGKFGPDDVFFDLINEPDIIITMPTNPQKWEKSAAIWGKIQTQWISMIRQRVQSDYALILSPDGWQTTTGITFMQPDLRPNLIMSFHYYGPAVFTHQGQVWFSEFVGPISMLPYPPDVQNCRKNLARMDRERGEIWFEQLQNYCLAKWRVEDDIGQVEKWRRANGNMPVLVGEFGALAPAPIDSKIHWYQDVLGSFRKHDFIGHVLVDYSDPIGCDRMADVGCTYVSTH